MGSPKNLKSQFAISRLDLIRPEAEKECPHAGGVHDQGRDSRSRDDRHQPLNPRTGLAEEAPWAGPMAQAKGRGYRRVAGARSLALGHGAVVAAELHWYEAHGIGRRGMKIKKLLI